MSRALIVIAGVALLALVGLLVSNALLAQIDSPFRWTYEVVSILGLIIGGFALAEAQVTQTHVSIDIITAKLGKRVQLVLATIVTITSIILFVYLSTGVFQYSTTQMANQSATEQLQIPEWSIIILLFLGLLGLIYALFGDIGKIYLSSRDNGQNTYIW